MPLLLGTDEAGYGPNLGPLIVGLSAWQIPADCPPTDIRRRLNHCVSERADLTDAQRIPVADSKQLYSPAKGLAGLEQAVLAAWKIVGIAPLRGAEVWSYFCSSEQVPVWHSQWDQPLPVCQATHDRRSQWQMQFQAGLAREEMALAAVMARVIQPTEFNRQVQASGSKGALLSEATLTLVRDALATIDNDLRQEGTIVICDKHGGRDRYAAVLQHVFPDARLEILREGRSESAYLLDDAEFGAVEFRFRTQGEECLPTALASMTAKYLRELSMHAFNAFWRQHLPQIKATAGYPQDAARFRAEIAQVQKKIGIADEVLWRCR